MQPKKHVHADLIKEYARQYADGEIVMSCRGWWDWEYYDEDIENWVKVPNPSWTSSIKYRFTKNENHPDFNLYISPGDSFEIIRDRKTIVTMHLAGTSRKVCFTDQTGRYFDDIFDTKQFVPVGIYQKIPVSVVETWIKEKIIKNSIVRCNRDYN